MAVRGPHEPSKVRRPFPEWGPLSRQFGRDGPTDIPSRNRLVSEPDCKSQTRIGPTVKSAVDSQRRLLKGEFLAERIEALDRARETALQPVG
jgi:hypothetical protein